MHDVLQNKMSSLEVITQNPNDPRERLGDQIKQGGVSSTLEQNRRLYKDLFTAQNKKESLSGEKKIDQNSQKPQDKLNIQQLTIDHAVSIEDNKTDREQRKSSARRR